MTHKFLTLGLASASALADTPWPECVNNPAFNDGGGCAVRPSPLPAAAAALLLRRRQTP